MAKHRGLHWPKAEIDELCQVIMESKHQAEHDFCGEQREWHLPRMRRAMALLMEVFPHNILNAMDVAKTPCGDPLYPERSE